MLAGCNKFTRTGSGILMGPGGSDFDYSDGVESELYLERVLASAEDLSSTSAELDRAIKDWPSEYHLSSRRANLLRGLTFAPGSKVLELGCGCGAITRYLGEGGLDVDAVEGSRSRAGLAAMRCRGLEKVNIVCADFNQLQFPKNYYDVILMVGVIEYAARFWPGQTTDEAAVVRLLGELKGALRSGGVVIVAIENRTGFKYVFGAHEDHYTRRYIGIHGYPEQTGTRTYSRAEWSSMLSTAGYQAFRFLLPFPDYKVPTVLLSEEYARGRAHAYAHLEGMASRDYVMIFDLGVHEPMFWESASANAAIPEYANSFLIVMGDDRKKLREIADDDFVHFPDFKRKRQYCVITRKKSESSMVIRSRVGAVRPESEPALEHKIIDETFVSGRLLSVEWSRSLLIDPWGERFRRYLSDYFEHLQTAPLNIDLVPTNIALDASGAYRRFDQEWDVGWELTPAYVFFRALMLFGLRHRATLREFARRYSLHDVGDFIRFGLTTVDIALGDLDDFIRMEERFQNLVNEEDASGSVSDLLEVRIDEPPLVGPVYAKVYWRENDQRYSEDRSITAAAVPEDETVSLVFDLPVDVSRISHIRFDPCDERTSKDVGFMKIPYLRVLADNGHGQRPLLELTDNRSIADTGTLSSIVYNSARYGEIFAVMDDNPQIEFDLTALYPGGASGWHGYRVEVGCTHIRSTEYLLVKDRFLTEEKILNKKLEQLEHHILVLKHQHAALTKELADIKASKLWKFGQRYRSLRQRMGG